MPTSWLARQANDHSNPFLQAFDDHDHGRDSADPFGDRHQHRHLLHQTVTTTDRLAIGGRGHQMDQPLDFSVRSPGSPGGESFCSQTSSRNNRRSESANGNSVVRDAQYWARRQKNNAAAKRSRDARRHKEEQTKHENQLLKEENEKLKYTVQVYKKHLEVCPHGMNNQLNL